MSQGMIRGGGSTLWAGFRLILTTPAPVPTVDRVGAGKIDAV